MAGSHKISLMGPDVTAKDVHEGGTLGLGLVVPPHLVQHATNPSSWAGYPYGQQHTLIKAAEARLAVQCGAELVAVVPTREAVRAEHSTQLLSEVVAIREAVPHPARLAVALDATVFTPHELARAAAWLRPSGVDALVSPVHEGVRELEAAGLPVILLVENADADKYPAHEVWITDFCG